MGKTKEEKDYGRELGDELFIHPESVKTSPLFVRLEYLSSVIAIYNMDRHWKDKSVEKDDPFLREQFLRHYNKWEIEQAGMMARKKTNPSK